MEKKAQVIVRATMKRFKSRSDIQQYGYTLLTHLAPSIDVAQTSIDQEIVAVFVSSGSKKKMVRLAALDTLVALARCAAHEDYLGRLSMGQHVIPVIADLILVTPTTVEEDSYWVAAGYLVCYRLIIPTIRSNASINRSLPS